MWLRLLKFSFELCQLERGRCSMDFSALSGCADSWRKIKYFKIHSRNSYSSLHLYCKISRRGGYSTAVRLYYKHTTNWIPNHFSNRALTQTPWIYTLSSTLSSPLCFFFLLSTSSLDLFDLAKTYRRVRHLFRLLAIFISWKSHSIEISRISPPNMVLLCLSASDLTSLSLYLRRQRWRSVSLKTMSFLPTVLVC